MLTWPDLEALSPRPELPPGLTIRQLGRADIPAMLASLRAWYPALARGAGDRRYFDPSFYAEHAALAGEPRPLAERPVYVMLIASGDRTALVRIFEYDPATATATMSVLAVDPQQRNRGLGRVAEDWSMALLRAVGAVLCMCWVTLEHPYAQRGCEAAGYVLAGILPGSERAEDEGGGWHLSVEAHYIKLLAPGLVVWPAAASLRPAIAGALQAMFERR